MTEAALTIRRHLDGIGSAVRATPNYGQCSNDKHIGIVWMQTRYNNVGETTRD